MNRDRFTYLCNETEAGRDAFVLHPATLEEGMVSGCDLSGEQLMVRTPRGQLRQWNFQECEELSRMRQEWPRH